MHIREQVLNKTAITFIGGAGTAGTWALQNISELASVAVAVVTIAINQVIVEYLNALFNIPGLCLVCWAPV